MTWSPGQSFKFKRSMAFGRAFRFRRGDVGVIDKVLPSGSLVFSSDRWPRLPFRLSSQDLDQISPA